jgi:hypothetical protein
MPDPTALTMSNTSGKTGPALSATSDMPTAAPPPAENAPVAAKEGQGGDAPSSVDARNTETGGESGGHLRESGEKMTDDDAREGAKSPDADSGDEQPAAKRDETPSWMKAELGKERERRRRAESERDTANQQLDRALKLAEQAGGAREQLADKIAKEDAADPRPARHGYDDLDKYEVALTEWSARKASRLTRLELQREAAETKTREDADRQRQVADAEMREVAENYGKQREAALEKYADFEEVTTAETLSISQVMADAIMRTENGAEIAYYLGKNPEEAKKIASLKTVQGQYTAIGRLEERLLAKPPQVTKTKPIVSPVGGRERAAPKTADEESMDEYAARREPELRRGARH